MRVLMAESTRRPWISSLTARASMPGVMYGLVLVGAAAYIAAFIVAALFRLSFPFPLEVTEAPALENVQRILQGQPLYLAPTLQHVPLIYGPVFFYLSALVALVTGVSYLPLRLVSLVASIGSMALVGRLVHRETGSRRAALVAAGLLAAVYPLGQTALDLGRVDALFDFFLLAGLDLGRSESLKVRPRWFVLAASGGLIGLAALTKAPIGAAPVALALIVYLLITTRVHVLAFVVGCAVAIAVPVLLLRLQSGPWPTWYFWDLPRIHVIRENLVPRFWFSDILPRLTLPFLIGPIFVVGRTLRRDLRPLLFYGLAIPSLIGVAWASRSNNGASMNVLLPAHVAVALLFGLGLHEVLTQIGSATSKARVFQAYALGLCLAQFALIEYNPRLTVPYRSDQWADELLAARLAALPGRVFAPNLDGYLRTSDKGEQPYSIAVGDLTGEYGGPPTAEGARWNTDLYAALHARQYRWVVLRDGDCCLESAALDNGYVDTGPLFPPGDEFYLLKTSHTPEEHLYAAPGGG